jgi:hypothetical protein
MIQAIPHKNSPNNSPKLFYSATSIFFWLKNCTILHDYNSSEAEQKQKIERQHKTFVF